MEVPQLLLVRTQFCKFVRHYMKGIKMESKHLHLNFCDVSGSGRIHVNGNCMFHSGCYNYVQ